MSDAGGAESMSRAAYSMPDARWGKRMGDVQFIDMMVRALTAPFSVVSEAQKAEPPAARLTANTA